MSRRRNLEFAGKLKPKSDEALGLWLSPVTWFKENLNDLNGFYDFVDLYQREHGYSIDEVALREEIESRVTKQRGRVNEELRDIIRDRISLAIDILDFIKRSKRTRRR
jgi:hypothetical protein